MSEERRVKRWAPKVFSGCQTCKRRRIKCDESKPTCQRCARSGLQCEGYAPPTARMFEPGKKNERALSWERTLALRQSASASPSISIFQTPEELRSFEFFMRKTADLISIYSQRHFWTTIIPQATHQHPAVKHSVLALSILHEALSRTDGLTEDCNSRLLHQYNTAIRALTQSQPTTDIVLITCILFWALENFNGAGRPSFDHMEAAQKILREFKAKKDHIDSPHYDVINRYIEPIIMDGVQHGPTNRVQDVTHEAEECQEIVTGINQTLSEPLPTLFPTVDAAQDHLKSCIRSLLRLLNQYYTVEDAKSLIERIETHLQRWVYLFHSLTATGIACNRRMLVVHHVNTLVLLAEFKRSLSTDKQGVEDFKSQYSWNVTEMEELLAARSLKHPTTCPPSHELGLIPPLFAAAVRCTDEDVRTRARTMLKLMSRDEGCWTDKVAVSIAEGIASAQREIKIGPKLNEILIERSDWGLSISVKDPVFNRFLGGSGEELEGFDMAALNDAVHRYGYQLDASLWIPFDNTPDS